MVGDKNTASDAKRGSGVPTKNENDVVVSVKITAGTGKSRGRNTTVATINTDELSGRNAGNVSEATEVADAPCGNGDKSSCEPLAHSVVNTSLSLP